MAKTRQLLWDAETKVTAMIPLSNGIPSVFAVIQDEIRDHPNLFVVRQSDAEMFTGRHVL